MKNIYSQLVVTFIIVVAASFLITLLMSDWIFQRQQVNFVQDRILGDTQAMAEIQSSIPENLMQKYLDSQGGQTQLVLIGSDGTEYRSAGNGPGGPLGISPPPLPLGNDSSSSSDSSNSSNNDSDDSTMSNSTNTEENSNAESSENTGQAANNESSGDNATTQNNGNTTNTKGDTSSTTSNAASSNEQNTSSSESASRNSTSQESTNDSGTTKSSNASKPAPPVPPHLKDYTSTDSSGKKKPAPPPPPKGEEKWVIPEAVQQLVLSGKTYHPKPGETFTDPTIPSIDLSLDNSGQKSQQQYVGVPFERDGVHYALFARPAADHFVSQFNRWMFLVLFVMLLIGVLLFLFAARLIARPIAKLSDATRRVAKGDYDVRVQLKRKDEIGQLGDNFNLMTSRLSKIEAMRQEFVSNVSHEIQTPITSIRGFAVALKDKATGEQLKHLNIIEKESERLSKLSSNLLKLASLDVVKLNTKKFRLDEQIRMAVVSCGPMWMNKQIELSADLDKIELIGDEDLLTQVWMNLLSNAIKFTPEQGNIYIALTEDPQWIKASVQDTGSGIQPEHVEHIFERFYKADSSRTSAVGGNGLGLSIVQKILALHGGHIEAQSEIGKGTTMTVYLPKSVPAPEKASTMTKRAAVH